LNERHERALLIGLALVVIVVQVAEFIRDDVGRLELLSSRLDGRPPRVVQSRRRAKARVALALLLAGPRSWGAALHLKRRGLW